MRFVFDTNVVVSALLLANSTSRRAFDRAASTGKILLSFPVLKELHDVITRPKFHEYIGDGEAELFLASFVREAEWVEINTTVDACRDRRDNMFLELAVSAAADCLVSGDKDLLALNPFRSVAILDPAEFLERYR